MRAIVAGCVVSAMPVLFCLVLLGSSEFLGPMLDQWRFLEFYDRLTDGRAGLRDWFAPHNGLHVIASMRLVLGPLALATGWSFGWEATVGFVLAVASTAAILRLGHFTAAGAPVALRVATLVIMVWLLWSPIQFSAWLWTVGFAHYFTNACVIVAVPALFGARRGASNLRFALACVLCALASFARIEGLFALLALLPGVVRPENGVRGER